MKKKLSRLFLGLVFTLSILMMSIPAQAWYRPYYDRPHYGYYYPHHAYRYYPGYHCKWVGGFYRHGYWHPRQRICWYR